MLEQPARCKLLVARWLAKREGLGPLAVPRLGRARIWALARSFDGFNQAATDFIVWVSQDVESEGLTILGQKGSGSAEHLREFSLCCSLPSCPSLPIADSLAEF